MNRVAHFLITASTVKRAVVSGIIFTVLTSLASVISFATNDYKHDIRELIGVMLLINVVSGIVFSLILTQAYKTQERKLNEITGVELTAQDRVNLALWQRKGVKPEAAHLQPALAPYADYVEDVLTGKKNGIPFAFKVILFIIATGNLILNGSAIIQHPHTWPSKTFIIVDSLFLMLFFFPQKDGTANWFMTKLAGRQLRKVARMRAQLS